MGGSFLGGWVCGVAGTLSGMAIALLAMGVLR